MPATSRPNGYILAKVSILVSLTLAEVAPVCILAGL
jgi:hypothetical protein